jgi:hypothetical protein
VMLPSAEALIKAKQCVEKVQHTAATRATKHVISLPGLHLPRSETGGCGR